MTLTPIGLGACGDQPSTSDAAHDEVTAETHEALIGIAEGAGGWAASFDGAPAGVTSVAMAKSPFGALEVFAVANGVLYKNYRDAGGWHGWTPNFDGAPAGVTSVAMAQGPINGALEVFAVANGVLYKNYLNQDNWHGWTPNFDGAPTGVTSVSMAMNPFGALEVFAVANGVLYKNYLDSDYWHGWAPNFASAPKGVTSVSMAMNPFGALEVFAIAKGVLYKNYLDGDYWHSWTPNFDGAPSGVTSVAMAQGPINGALEVFAVADGVLYKNYINQDYWHGWAPNFDGAPAGVTSVSLANGPSRAELEAFVVAQGVLYRDFLDSSYWHGWTRAYGSPAGITSMAASPTASVSAMDLFAVAGGTLYYKEHDPSRVKQALVGLGGKCATAVGAHPTDGARIVFSDCDGSESQAWEYDSLRGEYRTFGKCLDVTNGVFADRAPMQLYECNGTAAQRFKTDGKTVRPAAHPEYCLESAGGTIGGAVQLYDCNGTISQDWVHAPPFSMVGLANKCMTIKNGGTASGTPAVLSTCTGATAQRWYYDSSTGEVHTLGKCLDVSSSNFASGTIVQLWDCNGTAAQQFSWFGSTLRPKANTNYCVEAKGGFTADGTPVQLYACNGTASQAWSTPGPVPPSWDTLFSQFAGYDYNADGTVELNQLTNLNLGPTPGDPAQTALNSKPIVVVFVDPRIVSTVAAGKSRAEMLSLLTQYRTDLVLDGYSPVFVETNVYRGTRHQDGRTVLAMREVLRRVAHHYPRLHGAVLLGDFPSTFHAQSDMWTAYNPTINGTQYGGAAMAVGWHLYDRADVVLGDLDGRWEDLYRESTVMDGIVAIPQQPTFPLDYQTITSTTYEHQQTAESDIFVLKEDTVHDVVDTKTTLQFSLGLATNTDPELSIYDRRNGRTTALPEILVSRINARHVATTPRVPSLDIYGRGLLDSQGHPQSLAYRVETPVTWEQDPAFEQKLIVEYMTRNHNYRRGLAKFTPFRSGAFRGMDDRLLDPTWAAGSLSGAADGMGTPLVRDLGTAPLFFDWLKQPAILRAIIVHADHATSFLADQDQNPVPYPSDTTALLGAMGGYAWEWQGQWNDGLYALTPYIRDNGDVTYGVMRSVWENKVLAGTSPSFFVHDGCNANEAYPESLPYSDPAYARYQNAEALLFFGNGLGLMSRGKDNNDFPSNFAEQIKAHNEFGAGWRGYFETYTDRTKKSYFWSVLGDFTLKLTQP